MLILIQTKILLYSNAVCTRVLALLLTVYTCMSYWISKCCKEKPIASTAQDHWTITLLIIHFHCIYHVIGSIHEIDRSIYWYLLEFMYGPVPLSRTSQCNIVAIAGILRGTSQAGLHSSLKLEQFFSIKQHSFPSLITGKASKCEQLGIAPSQKHLFDLKEIMAFLQWPNYNQIQRSITDHTDHVFFQ